MAEERRWYEVAQEQGAYAVVGWSVDDVMALVPAMSESEAESWLADNAKNVQGLMTQRGWDALRDLAEMDGYSVADPDEVFEAVTSTILGQAQDS